MRKLCTVALVVAAALGCGLAQAQDKQLKSMGITLGSLGNPFFVALAKGAEAKAKQLNPNVKVIALSADYDLNKQFGQIDSFISSGVNMILIDLAQRESMNASAEFARLLYREAATVFPFRPDWHRFAAFIVLKAPDIPSILFESGYLTNETDTAYITSAEGRREIAEGMRRAVEAHFARRGLRSDSGT